MILQKKKKKKFSKNLEADDDIFKRQKLPQKCSSVKLKFKVIVIQKSLFQYNYSGKCNFSNQLSILANFFVVIFNWPCKKVELNKIVKRLKLFLTVINSLVRITAFLSKMAWAKYEKILLTFINICQSCKYY